MPAATCPIALINNTTNPIVFCNITGYDIDNGNKLVIIKADGSKYYPPSPPPGTTCQPMPADIAIPLGKCGETTNLAIPHIGGCRAWFSTGKKLTFLLNPGPSLVEPSITNLGDANIAVNWSFCELTFNADQVFANISCVDCVPALPVSATLTTTTGHMDHVSGMHVNGFAAMLRGLKAQAAKDKQPWDKLVQNGPDGKPLRILSPNNAHVLDGGVFGGYFEPMVDAVWKKYVGNTQITCDTQAGWGQNGIVKGSVDNTGQLVFDNGKVKFGKPSTADILSCCSGPFGGGDAETLAIIPRLSAAFNRGTLLTQPITPCPNGPGSFYTTDPCNHYARLVHEQMLDTRGYAFPYDDVCQNGGPDQCGAVYDSSPKLLTFAVGGNAAYVTPGAYGVPVQ